MSLRTSVPEIPEPVDAFLTGVELPTIYQCEISNRCPEMFENEIDRNEHQQNCHFLNECSNQDMLLSQHQHIGVLSHQLQEEQQRTKRADIRNTTLEQEYQQLLIQQEQTLQKLRTATFDIQQNVQILHFKGIEIENLKQINAVLLEKCSHLEKSVTENKKLDSMDSSYGTLNSIDDASCPSTSASIANTSVETNKLTSSKQKLKKQDCKTPVTLRYMPNENGSIQNNININRDSNGSTCSSNNGNQSC